MTATRPVPTPQRNMAVARRRWDDRHPGWWIVIPAAGAWAAIEWHAIGDWAANDHAAMPGMAHHTQGAPSAGPVWFDAGWTLHWLLMVVAMMWPLSMLQAAAVQRRTRPSWRAPAVAAFLLGTTVAWVSVGLALHVVAAPIPASGERWWTAGWLVVGALATGSHWRIKILRSCGRTASITPSGARSVVTATRAGLLAWKPCAALCGPVMVAMVVPHPVWALAAVSGATWFEQRHSLSWRHPVPTAVLTAVAAAVLIAP